MKIVQKTFGISTHRRCEMLDISGHVQKIVEQSGIDAGEVTIYCPHTTAAITLNENADPAVLHDILLTLDELFPQNRHGYRHSEGNSDAHCKSSLIGCSEQVLLKDGTLQLGTWQGIYFCEFDGPRSRKVVVQVRGE